MTIERAIGGTVSVMVGVLGAEANAEEPSWSNDSCDRRVPWAELRSASKASHQPVRHKEIEVAARFAVGKVNFKARQRRLR